LYSSIILFSYHHSEDERITDRNMLVNMLHIKIHNQIKVLFLFVYTFYKSHNLFCFYNTNCNERLNNTFFTTVPCVWWWGDRVE